MQKKYIYFFLYFVATQTCLSMHQLASPIITQRIATIASVVPQLNNGFKNCATNLSTPESTPKIEALTDKTTQIKSEDLAQLFKEILEEQKKQTRLLEDIKQQDNSIFAFFISRRTMLWFMMFSVFGMGSKLTSIQEKLNNMNLAINSTINRLTFTNIKLDTINNSLHDINFKNESKISHQ